MKKSIMSKEDSKEIDRWMSRIKRKNGKLICHEDIQNNRVLINFSVNGYNFRSHLVFNIQEESVSYNIYVDRKCPAKYVTTMYKLINKINSVLILGAILFNSDTGRIIFGNTLNLIGIELTDDYMYNFIESMIFKAPLIIEPLYSVCNGMSYTYAKSILDYSMLQRIDT